MQSSLSSLWSATAGVEDDVKALQVKLTQHSKEGRALDKTPAEAATPLGTGCEVTCACLAQVQVLRIDAKARRVDLTQRSEEERALDKKLTEEGARSIKVSGLNTLGAALARAGISKRDYEDISKVCWHLRPK